ncbi:MAG: hypothetical protein F4Z53_13470 [Acidimicrobiales bacterium]|nr:hypothetical protein [Acidimicrobiales bacterium]MYI08235.1 hypothetical protein [Acidimicrobiales bacterium]
MSKRLTVVPSTSLNVTAAALRTRGRAAMRTIRQRVRSAGCDARGIALQTVVIMVVLLVIAGSVAAVLVSRGAEVTGQLEETGIGAISETTCEITRVAGVSGKVSSVDITIDDADKFTTTGANSRVCFWQSEDVTRAQCFAAAAGEVFTHADAATTGGLVGMPTSGTDIRGCAVELA